MNPRYASVAARAGHRCEYCHAPEAVFNFPFEVEHVVPPGLLGADSEESGTGMSGVQPVQERCSGGNRSRYGNRAAVQPPTRCLG